MLFGTQRRGVAFGGKIVASSSPGFEPAWMISSPPCRVACFSLSEAVHHPIGMGRQMTAVTGTEEDEIKSKSYHTPQWTVI